MNEPNTNPPPTPSKSVEPIRPIPPPPAHEPLTAEDIELIQRASMTMENATPLTTEQIDEIEIDWAPLTAIGLRGMRTLVMSLVATVRAKDAKLRLAGATVQDLREKLEIGKSTVRALEADVAKCAPLRDVHFGQPPANTVTIGHVPPDGEWMESDDE